MPTGLNKQNVPITFGQGVDTKSDPKQVLPGKLLYLENSTFTSQNRLTKRFGYDELSLDIEGGGALSSGAGAMTFKEELLQFTGTDLYSYSNSVGRWSEKGNAVSASLQVDPVVRNTYQQTTPDSAFHPVGLKVFAWEDSRGGCRYCVIDSSTNQLIVSDQLLDSDAFNPKVVAIGSYVLISYLEAGTNSLSFKAISANTPSQISAAVTIATNVNGSNKIYDATIVGQRAFYAWNTNAGGGAVEVAYVNAFLTVSAAFQKTGEAASTSAAIFGDTDTQNIWVAYYNGTAIRYFVVDYDLAVQVLAPTAVGTIANVRNITGITDGTDASLFYEITAAQTYNYFTRRVDINQAGTVGTPATVLRSVGIASKPFWRDGSNYILLTHQSSLQPTYFLVNESGFVVQKIAPSVGGGLTARAALPHISEIAEGQFFLAYLQKSLLTTVSGNVYTQTGIQSAIIDFVAEDTYRRTEMANNQHISGGLFTMYDGDVLVEHGFNLFPENVSNSSSTSGGSVTDGTHLYSVCYEWTDNQGQVHRSAPSIPLSVVNTGSNTSTNTLTIPTLRVTAKRDDRSPVSIVVYRTIAAGTIYYQVSSITSPTYNTPSSDTVTFVDTASDASIQGNPLLYTTGGVIENIAAPAVSLICAYKNRVILVPSENRSSYWFSKNVVPGAPVEFTDSFVANVPQRGGDITSIIEMDDKLILFKRSSIEYTAWQGPTDTGSENDILDPVSIATDSGTINPRSVVLTPFGVMYQSLKGIYLLDRSLSVSYIGSEIEAYNNEVITAAVLNSDSNQIRFTTESGVALVYDYFFKQWSVFTNHFAVDALIFDNRFTYLTAAGQMMKESRTNYTDAGAFVAIGLVTSWFKFADLQGYQRVYHCLILGEYISPHRLQVQVAYDFNPSYVQTESIDATELLETPDYGGDAVYGETTPYGGNYPLYQWRINFNRQKCQAIQLRIEDIQTENLGEGFSLSAMTMRVGIKQGTNKLGKARVS